MNFIKNPKNNEKLITPKELIMLILADRTSIYLDICGFKLHFMQPNSLRELSDLFYLIYNMKSYNTEKEDTVKAIKDENCQKNVEKTEKFCLTIFILRCCQKIIFLCKSVILLVISYLRLWKDEAELFGITTLSF